MSRLDDELRNAFKRQQPPADFSARVLERVARQPETRPSLWQRLAALVETPKMRWVAIGVTAALLIAIGAAQYSRLTSKAVDDTGKLSQVVPPPQEKKAAVKPAEIDSLISHPNAVVVPKKHTLSLKRHQLAAARVEKAPEMKSEAEAAKDKLMLALSIASSALNDAQKAVHDDGLKP
ncbi:MAG TPA: hypothetical protein VN687_04820 [Blastocatellia bacterium]|nr:hypothetical protein [Blastocatellia bacterium]